jgi:ABC-type transport system involved in cytochrome bd biosynthesis fused ATPase/permease subunit
MTLHVVMGAVRENMDMLGNFPDNDIWHALTRAHAHGIVTQRLGGLDGLITSSGDQVGSHQKNAAVIK